jgi:hypothetical protein
MASRKEAKTQSVKNFQNPSFASLRLCESFLCVVRAAAYSKEPAFD